ncbi:hypothetical protein KAI87_02590, partial [Myxococcota bacterium]|nr:hypothetical protein [Myxococcota bacterium]
MEPWGNDNTSLFYDNNDVWSADFSDNDLYTTGAWMKSWILRSSDNPAATHTYGYACCHNVTPEPFRSRRELYRTSADATGGGVMTTKINNSKDTSFPGAATMCSRMGADLCSKSQYVTLNDNDIFDAGFPLWTNEQSDNDSDDFNGVIRATGNNPTWGNLFAYACCASQKLLNNSCSGTEYSGVCTLAIHDPGVGDTNFYDAARACGTLGADVCSKSQMQVLRNMTAFTGESWTNDGADNDNHTVGGLLSSQEDNPIPETELMGYACCL